MGTSWLNFLFRYFYFWFNRYPINVDKKPRIGFGIGLNSILLHNGKKCTVGKIGSKAISDEDADDTVEWTVDYVGYEQKMSWRIKVQLSTSKWRGANRSAKLFILSKDDLNGAAGKLVQPQFRHWADVYDSWPWVSFWLTNGFKQCTKLVIIQGAGMNMRCLKSCTEKKSRRRAATERLVKGGLV